MNEYRNKKTDVNNWDINGCSDDDPIDISTNGHMVNTMDKGTQFDTNFVPNGNVPIGSLELNQGTHCDISLAPNVNRAKGHYSEKSQPWTNGTNLNSLNFASVQSHGKSLNMLGQIVKDEDVIATWRSLSGLVETIFGQTFLSKILLMSHYIRNLKTSLTSFDKKNKK